MSGFIERLQIEFDETYERLNKLNDFLSKGKPEYLSDDDWSLLQLQQQPMTQYCFILSVRLDNAKNKATTQ